jgi:hypothetical protein
MSLLVSHFEGQAISKLPYKSSIRYDKKMAPQDPCYINNVKVRTTSKPSNCAKKAKLWNDGPSSQICHILVHLKIFFDEFKELIERIQLNPEVAGLRCHPS